MHQCFVEAEKSSESWCAVDVIVKHRNEYDHDDDEIDGGTQGNMDGLFRFRRTGCDGRRPLPGRIILTHLQADN